MISDDEIMRIITEIESGDDIDIKKTIENASKAGYLGEGHFYCTPIEETGIAHTVPEILGNRYESMSLDNLYYDIISKSLDLEGVYISLAYCAGNLIIPDEEYEEIIEYDDYDLEEDEYEYLVEYSIITTDHMKKLKIYAEEGIASPARTDDMGIVVKIIDGKYKVYFAMRSTDQCMSSFRVMYLTDNYQKEHPLSLKNPLNKIMIEMANNTIVLKS